MTIHFTYDPEKYFVNTIESNTAPDNSTTVAPDLQTGYWSKFTGKKWENEKIPETIEDIINLSVPAPVVYPADDPATQHQQVLRAIILRILSTTDKAKAVINDGVLKVVAVTEQEMLEEAKETKHSQLKSTMQSKRQALKVSYDDDEFDANETAQANMNTLLQAFNLGATSVSIRSVNEVTHTFNQAHCNELALLMADAVNNLYGEYWQYKDALAQCTTVDEVNEIVWN
ncbi:MAG TPA: hypothetical protein DCW90_16225 [Lachnospiraceae bacterium]|nr:hypothetical protein [Lachnospiraceae bacterium]